MNARVLPPTLLALTPGTLGAGDARAAAELVQRVRAAVDGGLAGVLLREPGLADGELLALARELRERFGELWLGLHDRPHLARAADVRAVHLGGRSLPPRAVRPWLPAEIAIGLSTHADDEAADWDGADYLFHGPVHPTPKPRPRAPVGPAGLARAVDRAVVGVWGLGGIGPEQVAEVLKAGARGVAVLSGILPAADPRAAAQRYAAAAAGR